MDRDPILQKFKSLNLWQKGGERAPHKPLLVLLAMGKLLRAESRLTTYSDIEGKLGKYTARVRTLEIKLHTRVSILAFEK